MATYVYRLFSEDQKLLYVGISDNVSARLSSHRSKPWFHEVGTFTLERFPFRREALIAEAIAINDEKPQYNKFIPHGKRSSFIDYLRNKLYGDHS